VVLFAVAGVCAGAACDSEETVDAGPGSVKQTVSFSWQVTDLSDAELPCDQIDAQFVTVSFFRTLTGEGFNEVFDCFRKAGTRVLDEGEYMIGFELADRFGTLATRPLQRFRVAGDTTLDEVRFRIDPSGGLVLTLDTGLPANCSGGSLITGMTIEMYRADATCQMSTLTIEPSGSYAINCASPPATGCIEKDRDVTAAGVPAGEYRIRVVGLQGANLCWEHDQRHRVRAAGLSRTLVLPLLKTCN
jgi:hypothetical protein